MLVCTKSTKRRLQYN